MKKVFFIISLFLITCVLYADYSSLLKEANELYKNGDYSKALIIYRQAYAEKPDAGLKAWMDKLALKVEAMPEVFRGSLKKPADNPLKWAIVGVNALFAGYTVYAVMDERSAGEIYNKLHSEIDGTTEENYEILCREKAVVDSKINTVIISGIITAAGVSYMLVDMFLIHGFFTTDTTAAYDPLKNSFMISGKF